MQSADAQIIEGIKRFGVDNVSRIARETHLPTETVRYKIKKQFAGKGIAFQVLVDYTRLGLVRCQVYARFAPEYRPRALAILSHLATRGYLIDHSQVLIDGSYWFTLAIPPNIEEAYRGVLERLREEGVLEAFEVHSVAATRFPSMQHQFYDVNLRKWVVDWHELARRDVVVEPWQREAPRPYCDQTDLLILGELQANALTHLATVAHRLGKNHKTVQYHYREHVRGRGLLTGCLVMLTGAWPTMFGRHWIVPLFVHFDRPNRTQTNALRRAFARFPFTFVEYLDTDSSYRAGCLVPVTHFLPGLTFLRDETAGLGRTQSLYVFDLESNVRYPLPHAMFDPARGWQFDPIHLREEIRALVAKAATSVRAD
jgi:DNA-binding Lrp family transcriptional regulator